MSTTSSNVFLTKNRTLQVSSTSALPALHSLYPSLRIIPGSFNTASAASSPYRRLGSPEGSIVSRAPTFGVGFLLAITLLVGALQENRLFPWSNSKQSTWYVSHYNLFRFEGTVLTTDRSLMSVWEVILLLHRSSRLAVHVRTRKIKNSHTWWARWITFQHTDLSTWYVNRYNSFRFLENQASFLKACFSSMHRCFSSAKSQDQDVRTVCVRLSAP